MTVRVDHVRLRFPLDLTVVGFLSTQPNDSLRHKSDTIADSRQLTVSVRLRPLFHGNVVVDRLELADTKLNSAHFVPSARVKGHVGQLSLRSRSPPPPAESGRHYQHAVALEHLARPS